MLICRICGYRGKSNHIGSLLSHLMMAHDITRGSREIGVSSKFMQYLSKYYGIPKCACGCGKSVNLYKRKMNFLFFANNCKEKGRFGNPTCPEYYLFRGHSVDKTIELIRKVQSKNVSEKIRLSKIFAGDKNPSSIISIHNRTGESIDSVKKKLKIKSSGSNNGFFGKKHTRDTLRKLAKLRSMQSKVVTRPELVIFGILKAFGIKFKYQSAIDTFVVDFLINDDVVFEAFGDFWHSEKFKNGLKKKKDDERLQVLKDMGYKVHIFWESEIMKNTNDTVEKIKQIMGIKYENKSHKEN